MLRLILRRLLALPIILLVVYAITFTLAWLIPGNPMERDSARRPPQEIIEAMQAQYHLDNPLRFAGEYLYHASGSAWLLGHHDQPFFNLGPSLKHENWTVNEILGAGLPVSITLGSVAMLIALVLGLTAGIVGGAKPGSVADLFTLLLALVGVSLPTFVIGVALLVLFTVTFPIFPVGGWGGVKHLILPAITLALPFAAYIARLTRYGMIEQMTSDHVRTARAKGAGELRILIRHALKNAFLPVLNYLGPASAAAMTGSFVVEKVFAVPGVGTHFVDAVLGKDLTLIMGVVLAYSTMLVVFNLVVDVLYAAVDPRIELA